jgi:1,2-phenylacetyl-CoA epoxidase catalytic subunit
MTTTAGTVPDLAARSTMTSLVWSLADNKAALGRRYADWAVSAPTLESAVAAAAMAQDELGHARSTYPVLKALGVDVDGDTGGGNHRLALLDGDLEDWTAFIAANLVIDGVLSAFVEACVDSTLTPMAQRARKILQEEGSHRLHAEAWTKRLCRSGDAQRALLLDRLEESWEHAGRWTGPADDPGFRAAVDEGTIECDARRQRERVRERIIRLFAGEGVSIALPEPADFSRWDATSRRWAP